MELVNQRTENSKTFALGKGKKCLEAHIGAIHYKDDYADPSEVWKDIDLAWQGNRITKAPYELIQDGQKFTLRNKKIGEISTIELLESKPVGLKFEVILEFSRVCFRHILPSDKLPFEAKFIITGKIPFNFHASDDEDELPLETTFVDGILTERLPSLLRPTKGNIKIDPTWQVGASTDDCEYRASDAWWNLACPYNTVGYNTAGSNRWGGGMRFTNVTIPQAATITAAYMTLRSYITRTANTVKSRISAEDVDDAPTFANSAGGFVARWNNRTTARVDWDAIPAWTLDSDYNSPEIKTVIQEVIDRASWASGNDIVIFWEDYDGRTTAATACLRQGYSYDGSTTYCAKLVITYIVAGGKNLYSGGFANANRYNRRGFP